MLSRHKLRQSMGPEMPLTSSVAGYPHIRVREQELGSCCCKVRAQSCLLAYKIPLVSQRTALLQAALAERDV